MKCRICCRLYLTIAVIWREVSRPRICFIVQWKW